MSVFKYRLIPYQQKQATWHNYLDPLHCPWATTFLSMPLLSGQVLLTHLRHRLLPLHILPPLAAPIVEFHVAQLCHLGHGIQPIPVSCAQGGGETC